MNNEREHTVRHMRMLNHQRVSESTAPRLDEHEADRLVEELNAGWHTSHNFARDYNYQSE